MNELEAVVSRHIESFDERPMQTVGDGAEIFGRFALEQGNTRERHRILLAKRLDAGDVRFNDRP
jgi:hypothetical protein